MDRLCSARRATLAYYEANIDTITFNTSVGDRNIDATYNHEKLHRHLTLASTSGLVEGLVSKVAALSKSGEGAKLHRIIRRLLQSSYDIHEGVAVYGSMLLEAAKDPGEPKLMYAQLPRSYRDAVDIVASAFEPVTKITSARVMYHYSILLSCGRVALDVPTVASSDAEPTVYYCIAVPVPLVQAWGTAISKISGVDLVGAEEVFSEADIYMGLFFHYVITKDSYVLEPESSADMT